MSLPNDPIMLLSVVNTKLRDFYSTLEDFCKSEDAEIDEITKKLESVGYKYDSTHNKFR